MAFTMTVTKPFRVQPLHTRTRVPRVLSVGFLGARTRIQDPRGDPRFSKWVVGASEMSRSSDASMRKSRASQSWNAPDPDNVQEVATREELDMKLGEEDKVTIVCFKAVWCKTCSEMEYTIKKSAEANPGIQFLKLDISTRTGKLYQFFTEHDLYTIPYYLVFVNKQKVSEGRWYDIQVPRNFNPVAALNGSGCIAKPKVDLRNQNSAKNAGCAARPKADASSPSPQKSSGCNVRPQTVPTHQRATKMTKEARTRNSLAAPGNMHSVQSVGDLYSKLFHNGEDIRSIICFKDVWCRTWSKLEDKVKTAAAANSNIQFLVLDVSNRNGDLFDYFRKNSQAILPYCLVYDSDVKVSEGRWGEIGAKILENT